MVDQDVESLEAKEEKEGLLSAVSGRTISLEVGLASEESDEDAKLSVKAVTKELTVQSKLAFPLAVGLIANYALSIISLSMVGQLGTQEMAAAALGSTLYSMSAKLLLMGLCGALDTYASQAVGSGNYEALGLIFQRTVAFLMAHTVGITSALFGLPHLLRALGQPAELTTRVGAYLVALLPAVWVDAVYRPLNRTLVAQRITVPQMWIGGVVALQHVGATYLCIYTFGGGYLGAAWATVWSNLLATALVAGYVCAAGLQDRVWGRPSRAALSGWLPYARLAYSSAAMKCIESWSCSVCTVVAGWLPNPEASVAAIGAVFQLWGVLYMAFAAQSVAATTRVGNALGAGKAALARLSALSATAAAPLLWLAIAAVLLIPATQSMLIGLFTSGADEQLVAHMRGLIYIVVVLEFFDGAQTVMSGVVSGAGKQAWGFLFNAVAYWLIALPLALLLGFWAGLGVEGIYTGMVGGPLTQCACYAVLLWGLRWEDEAAAAARRVQEACGGG